MIRIREIDHLVLRVVDLDRMLRFYCEALGCTIERRQDSIGLIQLRAGRSLVDLVPVDGTLGRAGGAAPGKEGRNVDHFCFRVEPFDEAEIRRHLQTHGIEAGALAGRYGAEGEGPSLYVTDPEGNVVELKGPPIGSRQAERPHSPLRPPRAGMSDAKSPMAPSPAQVSLRPITAETVRAITALAVAPDQARFVASNAVSLAEALFHAEAWYRAVYVEEAPVGFVMLYDESLRREPPEKPHLGIWRFMIDAGFQRKGIGTLALGQVIAHARSKGAFSAILVSYVPGPGCPEEFYLASGFRHTGRVDGGEVVLELLLDEAPVR